MAPVILLTRPAPEAARFADALRARLVPLRGKAAQIVRAPLLQAEPGDTLPDMGPVAGLIFTSRSAVRAYTALKGPARPCYCVGDATAALARDAGLAAISAAGSAQDLIARIKRDRPAGRWLYLRGADIRVDLVSALSAEGILVDQHVIYRQIALPLPASAQALLRGDGPVILPVFSPRSAKLLRPLVNPMSAHYIVGISDGVAQVFSSWPPNRLSIAAHPDAESMVDAVVRSFETVTRVEGDGAAQ